MSGSPSEEHSSYTLLHPLTTVAVLTDVRHERCVQDSRWGEQNHDPATWLAVLTEEVGELAQAVLADRYGRDDHNSRQMGMRAEAVQIAAVAIAFVEYLDRR